MASPRGRWGERLTLAGVLGRLGIALVLVYATYNPEGWSYLHWITHPRRADGAASSWLGSPALKLVVGILLAIGWAIFLSAARRSLGALGILLVAGLCAGLVWLLVSWEIVAASSLRGLTHIALAILAVVLAVGLSRSQVSRRTPGQVDADVVDPAVSARGAGRAPRD